MAEESPKIEAAADNPASAGLPANPRAPEMPLLRIEGVAKKFGNFRIAEMAYNRVLTIAPERDDIREKLESLRQPPPE